ncbi:unnamed protein product [Phaeothamnion confervicola]
MLRLFGGATDELWAMIDRATSDILGRSDTALNAQIAERINQYPNSTIVYEVVRRCRKKFKSANSQIIMHTLDLVDVLVKSCGNPVRREVGSEKFMKYMGKLCKIQRTKTDREFRAVAHRAQDLVQEWAETSRRAGAGPQSWFVATFERLRRDGVVFRDQSGHRPPQFLPGREPAGYVYDEEAAFAAAIVDSLSPGGGRGARGGDGGGRGGGGGGFGSDFGGEQVDDLSRVPPTVEALMDILEAAKSLRELQDNDLLNEVVAQCRHLREIVAKKVEQLFEHPDAESTTDRYLKAHDDLQTVLNLYDEVIAGIRPLPLPTTGVGRRSDSDDSSDEGGGGGDLLDLGDSFDPRGPQQAGAAAAAGGRMGPVASAFPLPPNYLTQPAYALQPMAPQHQQPPPQQPPQQPGMTGRYGSMYGSGPALQQQQQQQPQQFGSQYGGAGPQRGGGALATADPFQQNPFGNVGSPPPGDAGAGADPFAAPFGSGSSVDPFASQSEPAPAVHFNPFNNGAPAGQQSPAAAPQFATSGGVRQQGPGAMSGGPSPPAPAPAAASASRDPFAPTAGVGVDPFAQAPGAQPTLGQMGYGSGYGGGGYGSGYRQGPPLPPPQQQHFSSQGQAMPGVWAQQPMPPPQSSSGIDMLGFSGGAPAAAPNTFGPSGGSGGGRPMADPFGPSGGGQWGGYGGGTERPWQPPAVAGAPVAAVNPFDVSPVNNNGAQSPGFF